MPANLHFQNFLNLVIAAQIRANLAEISDTADAAAYWSLFSGLHADSLEYYENTLDFWEQRLEDWATD